MVERGGFDGLALQVTESGARSWVLRESVPGKQREMGLVSFPTVPLAPACEKARAHRAQVYQSTNPISKRQAAQSAIAAEQASLQTFIASASQYIEQHAKA